MTPEQKENFFQRLVDKSKGIETPEEPIQYPFTPTVVCGCEKPAAEDRGYYRLSEPKGTGIEWVVNYVCPNCGNKASLDQAFNLLVKKVQYLLRTKSDYSCV